MATTRTVAEILRTMETVEGAGVRLLRGFSYAEAERFDPFLLFDDFSSHRTEDHSAGFPWHPHRGIETVTYLLKGHVRHRDSLGNVGEIGPGDVQWMTAGKGIIHEEMPTSEPELTGFQLWVNLPRAHKMTTPRYQDVPGATIPSVSLPGATVRVIAGEFFDTTGPIMGIHARPSYFDITLEPHIPLELPVRDVDTVFVYVISGELNTHDNHIGQAHAIVRYDRQGDRVSFTAGALGTRLLLVSGTPLKEPIAWHGPIVMNTDEEIHTALRELRDGTFIS